MVGGWRKKQWGTARPSLCNEVRIAKGRVVKSDEVKRHPIKPSTNVYNY